MHLSTTDVSFTSTGCLTLHLKSSKTDLYRQGCLLSIAPSHLSAPCEPCGSTLLCVQPAVHLHCMSSNLAIISPGHHYHPHPPSMAWYFFRALCRIGAATSAAEAGLPPWLIQTRGWWSSNCYTLYIIIPPSVLQKVPGLLAATTTSGQEIWNPLLQGFTPSFP